MPTRRHRSNRRVVQTYLSSRAYEKLIWEINDALEPYYEDTFDSLFDAAEALLAQFLEYDEEEEDNDGPEYTEEGALVTGNQEGADESLSALDKEIRIWDAEEDDEVSDGSDHEEPAQSLTPLEIELQIKEKMLQL